MRASSRVSFTVLAALTVAAIPAVASASPETEGGPGIVVQQNNSNNPGSPLALPPIFGSVPPSWVDLADGRTDFKPGTDGTLNSTTIDPDDFELVQQRRRDLVAAAALDGAVDGAATGGVAGAGVGAALGGVAGAGAGLAAGTTAGLVAGPIVGATAGVAAGCIAGAPALLVGCIPGAVIGGTIVGIAGTVVGPAAGAAAGTLIGAPAGAALGGAIGAPIGAGVGAVIGAATAASEANSGYAQQNLDDLDGFAYNNHQ